MLVVAEPPAGTKEVRALSEESMGVHDVDSRSDVQRPADPIGPGVKPYRAEKVRHRASAPSQDDVARLNATVRREQLQVETEGEVEAKGMLREDLERAQRPRRGRSSGGVCTADEAWLARFGAA